MGVTPYFGVKRVSVTWVQFSSGISDIVTDIIHCLYDYREVSLKFYSFMQVRGNCKVIY